MALIELDGVVVGYQGRPVLPPVDLAVRRGTFLGVVGPNGSGKTTLVRPVRGLTPPIAGPIRFADGRRPAFGYVPQRDAVDPSFPLDSLGITLMGRYGRIPRGARPTPADGAA